MALERPESGLTWMRVPVKESAVVTVLGQVVTYWTHWIQRPGGQRAQPVRCVRWEAGRCAVCERGQPRRVRYVVPVRRDGVPMLLELGRVQYPVLHLVFGQDDWLGRKLRVSREWPARNAPIVVVPVGREHVSEEEKWDVSAEVGELGRGQLSLVDVPARGGEESEGTGRLGG